MIILWTLFHEGNKLNKNKTKQNKRDIWRKGNEHNWVSSINELEFSFIHVPLPLAGCLLSLSFVDELCEPWATVANFPRREFSISRLVKVHCGRFSLLALCFNFLKNVEVRFLEWKFNQPVTGYLQGRIRVAAVVIVVAVKLAWAACFCLFVWVVDSGGLVSL